MDECRHHKDFANEIKQNHLEIIDRLARIETKQDSSVAQNMASQNQISQLLSVTTEQGKQIAAQEQELKNIRWTAGIVSTIVTAILESISLIMKSGK